MNPNREKRYPLILAGAVLALGALPAAIAQTYSARPVTPAPAAPYYDAERDVMVTPRQRAGSVHAQTYRVEAPVRSSPGAVQPARAAPGAASYYDPVRDVIVNQPVSAAGRGGAQQPAAPLGMTFEFVVRNGQLLDGPQQIAVDHGSEVTLIVDSNMADALRLDGYNLVAPVVAGQPVLLTFTAERPGRFPYRLDSSGQVIGVIEVGPPRMSLGMR